MTEYAIVREPYYQEPRSFTSRDGRTFFNGEMRFEYVVARDDGSRVFRAESLQYAQRLQRRLTKRVQRERWW